MVVHVKRRRRRGGWAIAAVAVVQVAGGAPCVYGVRQAELRATAWYIAEDARGALGCDVRDGKWLGEVVRTPVALCVVLMRSSALGECYAGDARWAQRDDEGGTGDGERLPHLPEMREVVLLRAAGAGAEQ
jgi:hypothetical protein